MPGWSVVSVCPGGNLQLCWGDPLLLHQPGHHLAPGQPGGGGGVWPGLGAHPVRGGGGEGHGSIN